MEGVRSKWAKECPSVAGRQREKERKNEKARQIGRELCTLKHVDVTFAHLPQWHFFLLPFAQVECVFVTSKQQKEKHEPATSADYKST